MDGWGQFLCDLINDVAKEVENDSLAVNWDEFLLIKVSTKLINTNFYTTEVTYFCLGERLLRDGNCLAGDLQRRYSAFFALLLTAGTQTGAMQNAGLYSSRQSAKKDLIFTFKKCRKRRETFDNFPNVCN